MCEKQYSKVLLLMKESPINYKALINVINWKGNLLGEIIQNSLVEIYSVQWNIAIRPFQMTGAIKYFWTCLEKSTRPDGGNEEYVLTCMFLINYICACACDLFLHVDNLLKQIILLM